ncbi:MAG: glycosyltransferase family 4 protein [Phascolarctobacterium sp.]
MKILVVCQYYYPEPFRISDICEELVKLGHEVTVLTGVPNYPEGVVYEGYQNGEHRDEIINGVHVIRSYTIPRKKGSLYRLLNYYSYAISSSLKVLLNRVKPTNGGKFDIVFVNQLSPVMMAYAGMLYSWKHRKKLLLYCLDLWPESLAAGGIKQNSIVYKLFNKISGHIYKSCDHIMVTSYSFIDYLSKKYHIDEENISYLPQYAEDIFNDIEDTRHKDNEKINLVFAGNIGKVQSVQTIIEAAEILRENERILFHIVGGGTDLARLQAMVEQKGLTNVIFYGRRPIEEMPKFYAMADAMLVTLARDPLLSLTLPGKVQSYMAAGKPIIGAIDGETSYIIKTSKSGYVSASGDAKALADNITEFCKLSPFGKTLLGDNARRYYDDKFTKSEFIAKLTIDYL